MTAVSFLLVGHLRRRWLRVEAAARESARQWAPPVDGAWQQPQPRPQQQPRSPQRQACQPQQFVRPVIIIHPDHSLQVCLEDPRLMRL
jgi:hypothetical protein